MPHETSSKLRTPRTFFSLSPLMHGMIQCTGVHAAPCMRSSPADRRMHSLTHLLPIHLLGVHYITSNNSCLPLLSLIMPVHGFSHARFTTEQRCDGTPCSSYLRCPFSCSISPFPSACACASRQNMSSSEASEARCACQDSDWDGHIERGYGAFAECERQSTL